TTTTDVTDPNDGLCSLREAIAAIATGAASGGTAGECPAGSPGDTISVPAGTYTLTQGEVAITAPLTISGAGQVNTILDGNAQDRLFEISGASFAVNMAGLTLRNGKGYYTTTVALVGGLYNTGALTVTNSAIVDMAGVGLYNDQGQVTVD